MSDPVSRIKHDTSRTSRSVEGEDGLNGDVEGGGVEGFKHDLRHLLSVHFGVERRFGEEDGVLFGRDSELVVELWRGVKRWKRVGQLGLERGLEEKEGGRNGEGKRGGWKRGEGNRTKPHCVMPDLLHVVPVGNDTVLDGVCKQERNKIDQLPLFER